MKTFTIGFTQKTAEQFFGLIRSSGVKQVLDVRLNNVSQLSGFTKKNDLRFFLKELCDVDYVSIPDWVPTKAMLSAYKKKEMSWNEYEQRFMDLMASRQVERLVDSDLLQGGCLLCSEHQPHFCHRRLVLDYLQTTWHKQIDVVHLV